MKLVSDESAWDDYTWWQIQDRKIVKRINTLIKDIVRNSNEGIGKTRAAEVRLSALLVASDHRRAQTDP